MLSSFSFSEFSREVWTSGCLEFKIEERTVSNIGVTKRRIPQERMLGVPDSIEFAMDGFEDGSKLFCQSRSNQEETSCLVLGSNLLMSIDF